jgi:hypothetical protein
VSLIKLFSRRVLCLGLGSDSFAAVVRQGRQFQAATAHYQAVPNPEQAWQVVLSEMQTWLRQAGAPYRGLPLRITLASRWCQMQSMPWSDALAGEASGTRFLQNQFVALYGEAARDWIIQSDDAPWGRPRMACAIEHDLFEAVQQLALDVAGRAGIGATLAAGAGKSPIRSAKAPALLSLEPLLSLAVRTLPERVARGEACAIIEPGRFSLLLLERGRIVALQSQPFVGDWHAELASAWLRWTLRQSELGLIQRVAVLDLSGTRAPADAALVAPFFSVPLALGNLPSNLAFLSCDRGV